jgi:hypothetical protein
MTIPLPNHVRTGFAAIGWRRDGTPIWPVMGGDGTDDPPAEPAKDEPPTDPPKPKDDDGLGDGGKKALDAERKARKLAETELARFRKAEQDKADADKSELQKAAEAREAAEKRAAEAELRVLRLEVAQDKGLTAAQAKRLVGADREELEADADDLLASFPAPKGDEPRKGPKPDPSQGSKGEPKTRSTSLGAAVAKAISGKS